MNNVESWLIEWFLNKTGLDLNQLVKNKNFFELGYIDSLGIFELITEIESKFNFAFEISDFSNKEIETIEGLISFIVSRKK